MPAFSVPLPPRYAPAPGSWMELASYVVIFGTVAYLFVKLWRSAARYKKIGEQ